MPALRAWAKRISIDPASHLAHNHPAGHARQLPPPNEIYFFVGDAARVVEPFTGEGIYYALRQASSLPKRSSSQAQRTVMQ